MIKLQQNASIPCSEQKTIFFDKQKNRWLVFCKPYANFTTNKHSEVCDILKEIEALCRKKNLFAGGFVSYEAAPAFDGALKVKGHKAEANAFPLISFTLFKGIKTTAQLSKEKDAIHYPLNWKLSITREEYVGNIKRIKLLIRNGDTYQVNYTIRMISEFPGNPLTFFVEHTQYHPPPYSSFISLNGWAICSFSPELFFEYAEGKIISKPMKGTRRRGLSVEEDLLLREELKNSDKEKAENVMIVDMVRNDLSKIAVKESVKVTNLFDIEQYPTVWQMTSTVEARTKASSLEIFSALFPAASITGAPKTRTMEIISELEKSPRKIYTGTIGWIQPDGRMCFNVAIRTVLIDTTKKAAEYGVGGGIVWDSDPENEFEECRNKAAVLFASRKENFALLESILFNGKTRRFRLLKEHIERLSASARYFAFPFDNKHFLKKISCFSSRLKDENYKVRVILSRSGRLSFTAEPISNTKKTFLLRLAKNPVNSRDVFLYHKTTNRKIYEDAKSGLQDCDDVLLWNERGEITETTIANIIYKIKGDDRTFTPSVSCGLLAGTARAALLKKGKIMERPLKKEELSLLSGLWVVNSVRGIHKAILLDKVDCEK